MPSGFESWITIAEDNRYDGTSHYDPIALHVDSEDLKINKSITRRQNQIGLNRQSQGLHGQVYQDIKPEGGISFQFRSYDCLNVLYSHFQLATRSVSSSPYRYTFYHLHNNPDYGYLGTYPAGTYGSYRGQPYTVSLLKKYFQTPNRGEPGYAPNMQLFEHGICDELSFSLQTNNDARFDAKFKFRDAIDGTFTDAENFEQSSSGTQGPQGIQYDNLSATFLSANYATTPAFMYDKATLAITLNGNTTIPINGLTWKSTNGLGEVSRVGRRQPELFRSQLYRVVGAMSLDLPTDALEYVGAMLQADNFAITATLFNGTADRAMFSMPTCRLLPFDYKIDGGDTPIKSVLQFEAFNFGDTPPLSFTVDTDFFFTGADPFLDGWLGTRDLSEFATYTADLGARTLSDYQIFSRD